MSDLVSSAVDPACSSYTALARINETRALVTVVTLWGQYNDMLISELRADHRGRAMEFY